jgi:hippurate hydrolase
LPQAIVVPDSLVAEAVETRRDLHRHPELGFHEVRTAGLVASRLRELGIEVHERIATTGVIGILKGAKAGRTVMLRADMDALPMPDEKGEEVEYRSTAPGVMHACGHDGHVATLLGTARAVAARREELAGTLVFCFQPAEEGLGGARAMRESGFLERFGVERAYGLHYTSQLPTGVFGTRPGPLLASADSFDVEITGYGGHGSSPHLAIDPVAAAAESIVALNAIVARRTDPVQPAVVSVCAVEAGTTYNVIPTRAHLKGTIRAFDEGVRAALREQVRDVCAHACAILGASATTAILNDGFPVTVNDAEQAAYVARLAARVLGGERALEIPQIMGAEDFSYFAQRVPACFFFVGSNGGPATAFPNHHGRFDLDERALRTGIALMNELAFDAASNAP